MMVGVIAGCSPYKPMATPADNVTYESYLNQVKTRAAEYEGWAQQQDHSVFNRNATVVAFAVAGAAVGVFSHGAARGNWLAGLGIAAGGATALWDASNPESRRKAYFAGAAATQCLYDAGRPLSSSVDPGWPAAIQKQKVTRTSITTLTDDIDGLLVSVAGKSMDSDQAAIVNMANATAKQAKDVLRNLNQDISDWNDRLDILHGLMTTIDRAVATASTIKVINASSAQSAVNQPLIPAVVGGTPNNVAEADTPFDKLKRSSNDLARLIIEVGSVNSVSSRVAVMSACPGEMR
ncbi:hypothetical protein A9975_10755 [Cupriavidus sp. UME77]|nr:hypothetical protein [Cupriavidus sp. UME77]